jgi:two-component system chemotaxis sensor kinase CheA
VNIDRELLLATFAQEAEELFGQMEERLVVLESQGDEPSLRAIFRGAHTLKGMAMSLGFTALTEAAHALEDALEALLEGRVALSEEWVTLLLEAVDRLRELTREALAGRGGHGSEAGRQVVARLRELGTAAPQEGGRAVGVGEEGPVEAPRGRTLRVDVDKLDRIVTLTGELAIARGRLTQVLAEGFLEKAREVHQEADRLHEELHEEVMRVRTVPVGPLFRQHLRTVRDLARARARRARLVLEGEEVEVDTALVEGLREPLLHLVRNAVDHGLESPEERRAAGKAPYGTLVLRAFHEPGALVVELEDDGRGLRYERLRERAARLGLPTEDLGPEGLAELVFHPGLSTAEAVTEVSGRGVGMDVVRRGVEALRGRVSLRSEEGRGTTVTLRLPLTLATLQGFSVGVAEETYVLPVESVRECVELPVEQSGRPGVGVLSLRGQALPYLRLRDVFDVEGVPPQRESVVVLESGGRQAGLVVDVLHGDRPCVLKPLSRLFRHLPCVSGSTILGNGRVGLVLDVSSLLREALRQQAIRRTVS